MEKQDKQAIIESFTKAVISFVPGIGGAVGSILGDVLAHRKEKRINEFLETIKEDIINNKEQVNLDFVSKEDFLDVFEGTAKKIANERSEEKRQAYKNILVHGILSNGYSYDEVENQMRILDLLSSDHILLLNLFASPINFKLENANLKSAGTYWALLKQILPNWERDYAYDHIKDLENNRLVEGVAENFQTMMMNVTLSSLEGKLTSRGATFVSFILR